MYHRYPHQTLQASTTVGGGGYLEACEVDARVEVRAGLEHLVERRRVAEVDLVEHEPLRGAAGQRPNAPEALLAVFCFHARDTQRFRSRARRKK